MIFLATKKALTELIKNKIDEKAVLLDRAIVKNNLNPMQRLFWVIVEADGDGLITIRHYDENLNDCKWIEIEYVDNCWQLKENINKDR